VLSFLRIMFLLMWMRMMILLMWRRALQRLARGRER